MLFHSQLENMSKPRNWIYCLIILCVISATFGYYSLSCLNRKQNRSSIKQRFFRMAQKSSISKSEYKQCLSYKDLSLENDSILLPDISSEANMPTNLTKVIFFHETSCSKNHKAELSAFQACAVESAANSNPNSYVYVLFASPRFSVNSNSSSWMQMIDSIGNIHLLNNDVWKYVSESPAKHWLDWGGLFNSTNVDRKLSNFLRFVSLRKFGGTTIDLDVLSLLPLEEKSNFAGVFRNQENLIGNEVFNFKRSTSGRKIADECINDFILNYDKSDQSQTGPWVITRALMKVCGTDTIKNITPTKCDFTILPKDAFRPFDKKFDERKLSPYDFSVIDFSHGAYFSEKYIDLIFENSENVFKTIAKTYCPRVFSTAFN